MVPLDLDPKPLIVAEEMNTTTRLEHFRNLVRAQNYDAILTLAKKLVNEGSHMLDLCCAIVGEDEKSYMSSVLEKIATRVPAPILVDSTEADVIEEALKRIPGKAIINSINLEDGEKRTSRVLPMAKRFGATVIALTIDEEGMALTAERKLAIARRIYELATKKYGMRPQELIFDALTLPISTGQEEYRTAAVETLEAVRRIKQELPDVKTILGVSNVSFGLNAYARRVLNSVFMHEAVERGLDHGDCQLRQNLSAIQDSRSGSRACPQADFPGRLGGRSFAGLHGALCRHARAERDRAHGSRRVALD